jgi:EAL domain-containing protein (putative c-di-GMP-specific phosphodiesterase class I)
MATTTEGLEHEAQSPALHAAGCDELQVFLLSPRVAAKAVVNRLLVDRRSEPALTQGLNANAGRRRVGLP